MGEGRAVRVGVPFSVYPQHYKRDSAGKVYSGRNVPGSVYYDDSVPWEVPPPPPSPQPPPQPGPCLPHRRPCRHQGYFVDYIRALGAIAPWGNLSFHATSAGARMEFNDSRWDAAVQDVKSGIHDVAVSDFWVTKRRANMANMDQIYEESVYLFVPRVYAC